MTDFWRRLAAAPLDVPQALAVDPDGCTVYMSREVWELHRVRKRPRMFALRDFVGQTVDDPDFVIVEDLARKYIHYFRKVPPKLLGEFESPDHEMLVVVKYLYPDVSGGKRVGVVSTVYLPYLGEKR